MTVDDLLQLVPKLITKVDTLETELMQTKLTMGKALVKLVKKTPNKAELHGRKISAPTTLEAAKTLSKVASQRSTLVDKGKRYKRRKESKGKDIDIGFEDISTRFEDISTSFEYINTGFEEVNIGSLGVSTGSRPAFSSLDAEGQRKSSNDCLRDSSSKRTKDKFNKTEARTWKLSQLMKLKFEEIKEEFEKLVNQIDTFLIEKQAVLKSDEVISSCGHMLETVDYNGREKGVNTPGSDENRLELYDLIYTNGDDSHNLGTGVRRIERVARACTYLYFMKCQPLNFKGTEGVVELIQWFEKIETMTVWYDVTYAVTWTDLKNKLTDKYCLRGEVKKLEAELWNLKVKR
ncbi:hypothetical protein Tco_0152793 [Tanacetum coccineum]